MATTAQVTTLRELVMAHHAYERSLQEFARAAGLNTGGYERSVLRDICSNIDPREVDTATTINVIQAI